MRNIHIYLVLLLVFSFVACSKTRKTFNKVQGTWKIDKLEITDGADSIPLPSGGSFTFDDCKYKNNAGGEDGSQCSCSYRFTDNKDNLDAFYQINEDVGNIYKLGISNGYLNSEDTLNNYQISTGGKIYEINNSKLTFEINLQFVKQKTGARIKVYCSKE